MITVLADEQIPHIDQLFSHLGNVTLLPAEQINPARLRHVDVLLVRSVTKVNQALLANTAVRFVGSATSGTEHLDTKWLQTRGITWANTPGANAKAVAEYVLCCVAALQQQSLLPHTGRAAVVGVGQVGRQVANLLRYLGYEVLLNDPPRAEREPHFQSTPLAQLNTCDLICLHTPLTYQGCFASYHLMNASRLAKLKPGCVLLNAARGAVIDNQALIQQKQLIKCLDVYEHEPHIDYALLQQAHIATPHIAGYSHSAKTQASDMLYQRCCAWLKIENSDQQAKLIEFEGSFLSRAALIKRALACFDPCAYTRFMQQNIRLNHIAEDFNQLRRAYPLRDDIIPLPQKAQSELYNEFL